MNLPVAPNGVAFVIGPDQYGRTSTLKGERQTNGYWYWSIVSAPDSVRDDGEVIRSLTTNQLRAIVEAVQGDFK